LNIPESVGRALVAWANAQRQAQRLGWSDLQKADRELRQECEKWLIPKKAGE